jgi:hypothetical protein
MGGPQITSHRFTVGLAVGLSLMGVGFFLLRLDATKSQKVHTSGPEAGSALTAEDAAADTSLEPPFFGDLDCKGLAPEPPSSCARRDDALAELVRAAGGFTMAAAPCTQTSALMSPESVDAAIAAVDGLFREAETDRPARERIIAQNAALRLAICAMFRGDQASVREQAIVLRRRAIELVRHLALPARDLAAMGSEPTPEIARWLGDPSEWRDQRPPVSVAFHEQGYGFTKAIRTVIIGTTLANVGQLIAIDQDWKPHVTPLIGSLEVRRPLESLEATLCAASLDLDSLRCGAPAGLRSFGAGQDRVDPRAAVVFRTDHILMPCRSCHVRLGWPKGVAVAPGKETESVETRRRDLFQRLAKLIDAARSP